MKILDENNNILSEDTIDYEAGHLVADALTIEHPAVDAVAEQGHYVTKAEFPNGGKEIEWVVDVPRVKGRDAWTETEEIRRYVPYTAEEIEAKRKPKLTAQLRASDTDILEALETLLSCATPTNFLEALAAAGAALKETLDKRRSLRAEIAALDGKVG